MSQNPKDKLPQPRLFGNEHIYDHHLDIFNTMVTNYDLITTIKESHAIDFVDQYPLHLWDSNLDIYVFQHIM